MCMYYVGRCIRVFFYSFEVIFFLEGGLIERVILVILLYLFLKIRERFINKNVVRVLNKIIL